jgi:NAD(P)H-hydrate epimerase
MKALTAAEMREVDRLTTERYGIPSLQLMENAGRKAADAVWYVVAGREQVRVCVLCGKGNNGGDGFVVARYLKEQKLETHVVLFGKQEEMRVDAAANLAKWLDGGNKVEIILEEADWEKFWPNVRSSNVIVDAMLGTGLRAGASGTIARAIKDLNRDSRSGTSTWPALILAVDTPSGLPSDGESPAGQVLFAHRTVTFTAPKVNQLVSAKAEACGILQVVGIGSPAALIEETGKQTLRWVGPEEFASLPLVRAADSHKGTFGHALLLAGSLGKSGAAILAGYASLRTGAGLTTIACPDVVLPVIAAAHPEYMTEPLAATKSGALATRSLLDGTFAELEEGKSVLAIGPGLGTHKQTQEFVRTLVAQTELPILLDADGLNAFAGEGAKLKKRTTKFLCVTPHPGEMARLLGVSTKVVQEDRLAAATDAARKWNAHVVLKGFHTILAAPDGRAWVATAGSPSLAKGGSGDVLTGVLAALTAQFGTKDWIRVLALGVFLHGTAADMLSQERDPSGILAHEVAERIPEAREWLLREIQFGG